MIAQPCTSGGAEGALHPPPPDLIYKPATCAQLLTEVSGRLIPSQQAATVVSLSLVFPSVTATAAFVRARSCKLSLFNVIHHLLASICSLL